MDDETIGKQTEPALSGFAEGQPAAQEQGGLPATVRIGGQDLVAYDFGDDAGKGMENLQIAEQLIPFVTILQGLSPQLNPSKPEHIEGTKLGMLFNTATRAYFEVVGTKGLPIMPVWREHQYTEWVPRDDIAYPDGTVIKGGSTGGFRGIHDPNGPEVLAAIARAIKIGGRAGLFRPLPFHNEENNEDTVLVDQYNLGILYGFPELDEHTSRRAMLAFTSTKIGVYKAFITAADDIKYPDPRTGLMKAPPMWAHQWRLGVVSQTNRKGDFFNYRLGLENPGPYHNSIVKLNSPIYLQGREFYKQWEEGQVKGDYETAASSAGAAASNQERRVDPDQKDIPF